MPSPEESDRRQKAVLWAAEGHDNSGNPKVNAAIEIDVRWQTKKSEAIDANGNPVASNATVAVDRVIAIESIMWLGALGAVASPPVNLMKVIDYAEVPDVKARKFRRVVLLAKYSNELPTLNS